MLKKTVLLLMKNSRDPNEYFKIVDDYSGRGMFGETCVAAYCDLSIAEFASEYVKAESSVQFADGKERVAFECVREWLICNDPDEMNDSEILAETYNELCTKFNVNEPRALLLANCIVDEIQPSSDAVGCPDLRTDNMGKNLVHY